MSHTKGWSLDQATADAITQGGWEDVEPSKQEKAKDFIVNVSHMILSNIDSADDDVVFSKQELDGLATILETVSERVSRNIIGHSNIIADIRNKTIDELIKE
tara:strand:- start:11511 stop:11816 length:306 start_codon:yes stop_codon:yes gene_type:complete